MISTTNPRSLGTEVVSLRQVPLYWDTSSVLQRRLEGQACRWLLHRILYVLLRYNQLRKREIQCVNQLNNNLFHQSFIIWAQYKDERSISCVLSTLIFFKMATLNCTQFVLVRCKISRFFCLISKLEIYRKICLGCLNIQAIIPHSILNLISEIALLNCARVVFFKFYRRGSKGGGQGGHVLPHNSCM